jgi:TPP-dependent pyruvate/acetoin dehydrogenase alpha subunit
MSADVRRDAFNRLVEAEAAALIELVGSRNRTYAGGDPLKCWRKRGMLGLLVRLEDKLHRFDTFMESGGATEEQWRELLQDIAGYALCGLVWTGSGSDPSVQMDADE